MPLTAEQPAPDLAVESLSIDVLLQNNELLDSLILGGENAVDELIRQAAADDSAEASAESEDAPAASIDARTQQAPGEAQDEKQGESEDESARSGSLWQAADRWDLEWSLLTGLGYKKNALYNAFDEQDSLFSQASLDVTLMRVSRPEEWRFFTFLLAENAHYFNVDKLDDEWLVLLISRGEKRLGMHWNFGLEAQYTYLEQAFDIAFEEADLGTQTIQLSRFHLAPKIEYEWLADTYLRLEIPVDWNLYGDSSDNYNEYGLEATIGREYQHGSRVELGYLYGFRDYSDRDYRDITGSRVGGTDLEWEEQQINLLWDHRFDKAKRYRSRTKLRLRRIDDNGAGYDDFWMFRASQKLSVKWNDWDFSGDVSYTHYDYDNQTVSATNLNHRYRSFVSWGAGIERSLGNAWELTLNYRFEDYLSNLPEDEYDVHTISFGITREF